MTVETIDQSPTPESIENLEEKLPEASKRKKTLRKLTLNDLLEVGSWAPDNIKQWEKWVNENKDVDQNTYPGVRYYDIFIGRAQCVIKARKHSNGGYQILEFAIIE